MDSYFIPIVPQKSMLFLPMFTKKHPYLVIYPLSILLISTKDTSSAQTNNGNFTSCYAKLCGFHLDIMRELTGISL